MSSFRDDLRSILEAGGLLDGDDIEPRHYTDPLDHVIGRPSMVLRPSDTAQVSRVLAACHAANRSVLTQGGMTGLVHGGLPNDGEVVLTLERMDAIEQVDTRSGTLTVEAGAVLQRVQEHAENDGFIFPLDMGSRGSCTIGGNIATNAGGNRVIRYGMMRDLVLGLEVVLADGTVLHGLRNLVKNNTGYDLKQLFVGSEGTLGVVTRAVLRLSPKPASQNVALCALPGFDEVVRLLHLMRRRLPGSLSAFEVMWNGYYKLVVECVENVSGPFEPVHPYYALVESLGADAERDTAAFEDALSAAFEEDLLADAVLSKSPAEVRSLWSLRDASLEAHRALGAWQAYDISLPIAKMETFAGELMRRLDAAWPGHGTVLFGHLGDGNLHVQTNAGGGHGDSDELIYTLTGELEGSISAEHGIGYAKKRYLHHSRTGAEIALMARVKAALDPRGILNPGRIFNGAATS